MNIDGMQLRHEGGLWLGAVSTNFGLVEVLLGGTESGPDEKQVLAYRRFAEALDGNIARLRKQIFFGFLWRPIRIAINTENRVGVQFRNRLTGNQGKLILDEEPGKELRPVAGAAVLSHEGKVIYNLLTVPGTLCRGDKKGWYQGKGNRSVQRPAWRSADRVAARGVLQAVRRSGAAR